jgi:hypothetical protein
MESRSSLPAAPSVLDPAVTVAEDLPELYRAILDRVGQLERIGQRLEAGQIRVAATEAYSVAWDEDARGRLSNLLVRADRAIAGRPHNRGWTIRRRSARSR